MRGHDKAPYATTRAEVTSFAPQPLDGENAMEYAKPELNRLGATLAVMRGVGKQINPISDWAFPPNRRTLPAYEADE